jgi:hypothetical protein
MKYVTISGYAQHGKDTVAKFLKEILEENNKKVLIVHYADYLKFICEKYFGWNGIKDETGRQLLQQFGTNIIRQRNSKFWVNIICELSDVLQEEYDYILVPDCRFPDEVETPKKDYDFNVISIHVARYENGKLFDNGLTEEQKNHISETSLNTFIFDYYVYNNSNLAILKENLRKIANKI